MPVKNRVENSKQRFTTEIFFRATCNTVCALFLHRHRILVKLVLLSRWNSPGTNIENKCFEFSTSPEL